MAHRTDPGLSSRGSPERTIKSVIVLLSLMLLCVSVKRIHARTLSLAIHSATYQTTSAQDDKNVRVLERGKPMERELRGGEVHFYDLTVDAGQFLWAVVYQRGIDVVVTLYGPDGTQKLQLDTPNGTLGPEQVALVAEVSGSYRLEVRSYAKGVAPGRYEVKIQELRSPSPHDQSRAAAVKVFAEANQLTEQATAESRRRAVQKYEESLPLWRAVKDRYHEAQTLSVTGSIYIIFGERQKALEYLTNALTLERAIEDRHGEADTLYNIGFVYDLLGEKRKALDYYGQSLSLKRVVGDRQGEATALLYTGIAYAALHEPQKALEYFRQVLPLWQAIGYRWGEAYTLNNMGQVYLSLGEPQKALEYYQQALPLSRMMRNNRDAEAYILSSIGEAYASMNEPQKARDSYDQALSLWRATGTRHGEAITLFGIARVERDRGNLTESRAQAEAALGIIESLRTKVVNHYLRTSYFATVRNYFEFYIDLLMRLHKERPGEGFDARALQASESARARSLLDLLSEASIDINQGVDSALLKRERSLQQLISDKADSQMRLLSSTHTPAQAAAAAKEIDQLATEYEQVKAQIRNSSPHYAALTEPQPLSLREIQTNVLDDRTLLLEYSLGEEKSYLWAVTPVSIESFELPKRAEIETVARRLYESLTERKRAVPNETLEQKQLRLDRASAEYAPASAALSRMLLAPVASQLGTKRLLIISDGALQYIPFGALPVPEGDGEKRRRKETPGGDRAKGRHGETAIAAMKDHATNPPIPVSPRPPVASVPLVVNHEIVSLPSASVLAVLRKETAGRASAAKAVAVLADPVFDHGDPRVGARTKGRADIAKENEAAFTTDISRSATESGLEGFVRLRFSRQEAEASTRLAPEGKKLTALDFAASREAATSTDLGQYRIVHFATHGLINSQHPELSGLVLSLVDQRGKPQNGFLRLHEIYNLRLGADLVVLSACQTALGKEIQGEGLIGLTRGFMYAGAPRVVASLWQVDDRATADLMRRFYEGMLRDGLPPAAALRSAQVSMLKEKRWQSPYYWAAFTVQGEWN